MAALASAPIGSRGSLDGSEPWTPDTRPGTEQGQRPEVAVEEMPMPEFEEARRRRARRTRTLRFNDSDESVMGDDPLSGVLASSSSELVPGSPMPQVLRGEHGGHAGEGHRETVPGGSESESPMDDPWLTNDPWRNENWQVNAAENWSNASGEWQSSRSSEHGSQWSWRSSQWSSRSWDRWQNWETASSDHGERWSDDGWRSDWPWKHGGYHGGDENWSSLSDGRALSRDEHGQDQRCGQLRGDDQGIFGGNDGATSPVSPQAPRAKDTENRPLGDVPSGVPSVAGNQSQQATGTTGKLSSSYPPIFYARPGESWEQYWRSVTFWVASEGKSLPQEMQGPRLMQQLRERAGKIVQHLTVEEVSGADGIQRIKQEMERSPIIKLLDQKKVDQRRQKFMKLTRLHGESIESFLNRAEIYRRENQSSPAYQVGSKFYIGHLLDAARLTKRDLALVKAASQGTLEDEDLVTTSLMDLAEQLEGQPGCPIGRGEPTLDHEDKYLVQKATTSSSMTSPLQSSTASPGGRKNRRKFFGRRRFRDALMAILEDEDGADEEGLEEDPMVADGVGDESVDEEDDDMTSFSGSSMPVTSVMEASSTGTTPSTMTSSSASTSDAFMAEIFAQEYKARNRVREIKKMRQYFQKEGHAPGGPQGDKDREQVKRWVKQQQKTEPCFICRQLGHWSQECPYRNKAPVHATNVTFPAGNRQADADWDFLRQCAQSEAMYKSAPQRGGDFRTSS